MTSTGQYLGAGGDLLGGIGDAMSSFAASSTYGNNAEIDKIQAGMATVMTRVNSQRQEDKAYQVAGGQTAAFGANGLNTSGSALDVLHQTARDASLDKSLVNYKGGVEALNWQLKYKSDKKAQSMSFLGGVLDVVKGVAMAGAVLL